jgi:hypothetical protein
VSTYEQNLCDLNDVLFVLPEASKYNQRSLLSPNWVASGTSNLYNLYSPGYIASDAVLYVDGQDLGVETGSEPSSNNEWRYTDNLIQYFKSGTNVSQLNGSIWEIGQDTDTLITSTIIPRASDMIRSMVQQPLYPRRGVGIASKTGHDFPEVIVMATAYQAANLIVGVYDTELRDELASQIMNAEETGIIDKIRNGSISLYQHNDLALNKGIVRKKSVNGSSTADIVDIRGRCLIEYDLIEVKIDQGGTLTRGTDNTVITFSTKGHSSAGLQTAELVTNHVISGGYDNIGRGLEVRFSYGILNTGDSWEVECSGIIEAQATPVKMVRAERI